MATPYDDDVKELLARLGQDQQELKESRSYYEATYRLKTIGLAAPPEMRELSHAVGWPRMYLDAVEERLDVEGFRLAGSSKQIDEMWDWWQYNGLDEESGLAHLDALIYGRSYVTVAAPGPGDTPGSPIIRVESPRYFYAERDDRTRQITRAVRIYVDGPNESRITLYLPNATVPMRRDRTTDGNWQLDGPPINHNLGVVPVVTLANRPTAGDRTGTSEILEEIRSFTDAASRTIMNMQSTSELMANPQRYLFGVEPEELTPNGTHKEVTDAYMARILSFADPEGKAGQFQAAELRNYGDALQELAKHIASYTGLPPQYLSFQQDNPASAEAIRSAESRLVKKCERKARQFGGSWEDVMRLCLRVLKRQVTPEYSRLETVWRNPATPTFAAKADAVTKLYDKGDGVVPREYARIELGYSEEVRRDMKKWDDQSPTGQLASMVRDIPRAS